MVGITAAMGEGSVDAEMVVMLLLLGGDGHDNGLDGLMNGCGLSGSASVAADNNVGRVVVLMRGGP